MPSSAHDPAGESREPEKNTVGGVPAADGAAHHPEQSTRTTGGAEETCAMPPVTDTDPSGAPTRATETPGAAAAGQPGAPAYTPPAALASMTGRHWWVPVVAGLGGYAGMLVGTAIALLLSVLGLAIADDSSGSVTDQFNEQIKDTTGVDADTSGIGMILSVPFQLAAMAALVPLRVVMSFGEDGGSAGITVPQYFALACGILTAWFLARKLSTRMRVETRAVQWVMAAVAGLTWGAVALILTALTVLRMDIPVFYSNVQLRVTAVGGLLFPVLFVVGLLTTAAAFNARSTQTSPGRVVTGAERTAPGLLQVLRPVAVQVAVFGAVAGLGLLITAFVQGGAAAGFSALLWLPLAVGWLLVLSLLSAMYTGGAAASWADLTGRSHAAYLWTDGAVPPWAVVLCILLAVLSVVCAALAWAHVRPLDQRVARNPFAWAVLPVTYFLLGLLLMWLLNVGGYMAEDGGRASAAAFSVRPAGWTCLVFLLWGVVIELLARFVAPAFMHSLPAPLTRALRGSDRARNRAAVVASAAAMGGAGVAAATAHRAPAQEPQRATSPGQYPADETVSAQQEVPAAPAAGEQTRTLPSYDDPTSTASLPVQRTPMDPAKKKRIRLIAIIVGALVLLGVVAAVVFSILSRTVFGPDNQAEELLQSVQNGKASAVTDAANPNVNTGQRALLTDGVYGAAQNRISSYEVKDTEINGDHATVHANVTQDGVTTPVDVPMVSDSRNGLFKSWRVDDAAGVPLYQTFSVEIPAGVGELTVNDQKITVDTQNGTHTQQFTVLPGDYAVGVASPGKYVTYGGKQVAEIRAGAQSMESSMAFSRSFTPALEQDLTKQLNAKLDTCAKSADFEPQGCPFEYSIFGDKKDYQNPSWTIERYPTYSVSSPSETSDEISYSTSKSGKVRLDYQYNEQWDEEKSPKWKDKDTTSSIYSSGTVTVSGDKLTVKSSD
ncbi:hypothetical protein CWC38_04305 [Kocuria tytonicola]|uniref:DMT family transporter n=1 Tax=Kocuria tytonicola TaxID=2055946 RepID=UPI000EF8C192|nr:DMT family transporter [Kocuria tytonicola]RLZ03693.1 hypothetical protein CWC38_04305 [Kocuria tytonicola]